MSEEHLILAIAGAYGKLSPEERKKKIRLLCREDEGNKDFIKKKFPQFYKEAYPSGDRH